jgi:hypothetical protein
MFVTSVRRLATWLVLISLFVLQTGALIDARHNLFTDDAACEGIAGVTGAHHADGAQFETALPSPPLEHCAFCHLQRAFGHARPGGLSSILLPPQSAALVAESAIALASGVQSGLPPRGPPTTL